MRLGSSEHARQNGNPSLPLASAEGVDQLQLEELRRQKLVERGGFSRRIYLIETLTVNVTG